MDNLKEYKGIEYRVEDDHIKVCGANKDLENIDIPSEIDGVSITIIGTGAFYECTKLKKVNLPEGITKIEEYAFSKCILLEDINFPQSLEHIEGLAFDECYALKSVNIPEIKELGQFVFKECTSLTDVYLGNANAPYTSYAFPTVQKKYIKFKGIEKNTFKFEYPNNEFSNFGIIRNKEKITIEHISGCVPHVHDIIRALKMIPKYMESLPERLYTFAIDAKYSSRDRGYYKLVYFKRPTSLANNVWVTGVYDIGIKLEINSSGKVEDWLGKEIYILDFLEILYIAGRHYAQNKVIKRSTKPMDVYSKIKHDIAYMIDVSFYEEEDE